MHRIDLKKLLIQINDEKDLHADLCLDLDCVLPCDDPRPLIRSLNYTINYLRHLSRSPLQIGLSAQEYLFRISFLAHPLNTFPDPFRQDVIDVLRVYGMETVVDVVYPDYAKILLTRRRLPEPA